MKVASKMSMPRSGRSQNSRPVAVRTRSVETPFALPSAWVKCVMPPSCESLPVRSNRNCQDSGLADKGMAGCPLSIPVHDHQSLDYGSFFNQTLRLEIFKSPPPSISNAISPLECADLG